MVVTNKGRNKQEQTRDKTNRKNKGRDNQTGEEANK